MLGLRQISVLISGDEGLAFRILALNTEKAHNLKDRSLEVIRMARELAVRRRRARESDFEAEFEAAELLTLGIVYEQQAGFAGGAYSPFLKKVDRFSTRTLAVSLRQREGLASRLLGIEARVKGTTYSVAAPQDADTVDVEVFEGVVRVAPQDGRWGLDIPAGHGVSVPVGARRAPRIVRLGGPRPNPPHQLPRAIQLGVQVELGLRRRKYSFPRYSLNLVERDVVAPRRQRACFRHEPLASDRIKQASDQTEPRGSLCCRRGWQP